MGCLTLARAPCQANQPGWSTRERWPHGPCPPSSRGFQTVVLIWRRQGERKPKGGPRASRTLDPDLSPMLGDDGLADVQADPQAHPGPTLHLDAWHAMKTLPEAFLLA